MYGAEVAYRVPGFRAPAFLVCTATRTIGVASSTS
jgi:hypothetical protein